MANKNIQVIIVGAGYAGIGCAIECKRKGLDVTVLEKFEELKIIGESLFCYRLTSRCQSPRPTQAMCVSSPCPFLRQFTTCKWIFV
jgi:heterodisulfide reductase subunit A-like polyferredoxin